MVYAMADIDSDYIIDKSRISENGTAEEIRSIEHLSTTEWISGGDFVTDEAYFVDGQEISAEDGLKARTEAESDYSRLLMYSGNLSLNGERTAFSNISGDDESEAVSYNDAIIRLDEKINEN